MTKRKIREPIPESMKRAALKRAQGQCEKCYVSLKGLKEQYHHVNHKPGDNRIENILVLCPNCHSKEHYDSKDGGVKKPPKPPISDNPWDFLGPPKKPSKKKKSEGFGFF